MFVTKLSLWGPKPPEVVIVAHFSLCPSWSRHLTSVTASKEAECLSSRSMDRMWFFLQAIWRGVKPFW